MNTKQDLLEKVQEFQNVAKNHDVDKIMDMFAEDAKFHIDGQNPLIGKDLIRSIFEYDAGVNGELEFINCSSEGDTVSCQILERNDRLKASGINELFYPSCVFTFSDGLIIEFKAVRDAERAQAQAKMWPKFRKWVSEKYPNDYLKLFDAGGKFIRNFENGKRSVHLLKEWRESQDS